MFDPLWRTKKIDPSSFAGTMIQLLVVDRDGGMHATVLLVLFTARVRRAAHWTVQSKTFPSTGLICSFSVPTRLLSDGFSGSH